MLSRATHQEVNIKTRLFIMTSYSGFKCALLWYVGICICSKVCGQVVSPTRVDALVGSVDQACFTWQFLIEYTGGAVQNKDGKGVVLFSSASFLEIDPYKNRTTHELESDGNLVKRFTCCLLNVSLIDAGSYSVSLIGTKQAIILYVIASPDIRKPVVTPDAVIGETVSLTSTSQPQPTGLDILYSWTVNSRDIQPSSKYTLEINDGSILKINNLQKEDKKKEFRCLAKEGLNGPSSVPSDIVTLNVLYGPGDSIRFEPSKNNITLTEGESTTPVKCNADCYPQCTYQWIRMSDNSTISTNAILLLTSITRSQSGTYRCISTNTIMNRQYSTEKDLMLNVTWPPEKPYNFYDVAKSSSSITVFWMKGYNGGDLQTFVVTYRDNTSSQYYEALENENTRIHYSLRIDKLKKDTTYIFNLHSFNTAGNSSVADNSPLMVTTNNGAVMSMSLCTCNSPTGTVLIATSSVLFTASVIAVIIEIVCLIRRRSGSACRSKTTVKEDNITMNESTQIESNTSYSTEVSASNYQSLGYRGTPSLYDDIKTGNGNELSLQKVSLNRDTNTPAKKQTSLG